MQQKPFPKCIALQSAESDHLGFMLIALEDGALSGECVFIVVPRNPSLFDSPIAKALLARKAVGESKVEISRGESLVFRVSSPNLPNLTVHLNGAGVGSWCEAAPGNIAGLAAATTAA